MLGLWPQLGLSFVGWTAYGVWLARSRRLRPSRSPLLGALAMVGGALALFLGLAAIAVNHGFTDGRLRPWAFFAVTALGVLFVHAQAWGALAMTHAALRRETTPASRPSEPTEDLE